MRVRYFFRKPSPHFHSIEELFFNIQKHLPKDIEFSNYFAKFESRGFFKRLLITILAVFKQQDVNHITGDIHFISYFLKKKRSLLTIHDIAPLKRGNILKRKIIKFFWFTLAIRRVKYITVISEFTKSEIIQHLNIKPDKIFVIPNTISSLLKYNPRQFNSECPTILQIGTKENKNIPRLIEAITNIKCKLIVVGKLNETQINLLIKNKIDYQNYYNLEYNKIIELYKLSDIVAFVSTYEGFGVPILEANATGRVIITANISPMKEIAQTSAYLVNPESVTEIYQGIKNIINDAELRNRLITNGLLNVEKYKADNIAKMYANLYQKILTNV